MAGCNVNAAGLPMFHLRRIGPSATAAWAADIMDFHKVTCIIGRSRDKVDFLIDSTTFMQSACISRCHARVVRQPDNRHMLHDDSMNGVFLNNIKISGRCLLREGDRVTFGHPMGMKIPFGSRTRQPDSEHQFIFEACHCDLIKDKPAEQNSEQKQTNDSGLHDVAKKQTEVEPFKKPISPAESSKRTSTKPPAVNRRNTRSFTQEDVKQLKQSYEAMQSSAASADLPEKKHDNQEIAVTPGVDNQHLGQCTSDSTASNSEQEIQKHSINMPAETKTVTDTSANDATNIGDKVDTQTPKESAILGSSGNASRGSVDNIDQGDVLERDDHSFENASISSVKVGDSNSTNITDNDSLVVNGTAETELTEEAPSTEALNLEGAVNCIIKELGELRDMVDGNNVAVVVPASPDLNASGDSATLGKCTGQCGTVFKSPSKDACIQTSQSLNETETVSSPSKDVESQTNSPGLEELLEDPIPANEEVRNTEEIPEKLEIKSASNNGKKDDDIGSSDERPELEKEEIINEPKPQGTENKAGDNSGSIDAKPVQEENEDGIGSIDRGPTQEEEAASEFTGAKLIQDAGEIDEVTTEVEEEDHECVVISSENDASLLKAEGKNKTGDTASADIVEVSGENSVETSEEQDGVCRSQEEIEHSSIMLSNSVEFDDSDDADEDNVGIILSNSVEFEEDDENDNEDYNYESDIPADDPVIGDQDVCVGNEKKCATTKEQNDDLKEEGCGSEMKAEIHEVVENKQLDSETYSTIEHEDEATIEKVAAEFEATTEVDAADQVMNAEKEMDDHAKDPDTDTIPKDVPNSDNEQERPEPHERVRTLSGGRKRHMSDEISEDYGKEGERKRTCSGDNSLLARERSKTPTKATTSNLQKLKHGVMKFFKAWKKKSSKYTPKPTGIKSPYVYLKDNAGSYRRLSVDKSTSDGRSANTAVQKDAAEFLDDSEQVAKSVVNEIESVPEASVDNLKEDFENEAIVPDTLSETEVGENTVGISVAESDLKENSPELNISTVEEKSETDIATELEPKSEGTLENDCDTADAIVGLNSVATIVDETNSDATTLAGSMSSNATTISDGINSQATMFPPEDSGEQPSTEDEANTSVDLIEASVCYTDNDCESDDQLVLSRWLNTVAKTPVKQMIKSNEPELDPDCMSPVIERQGKEKAPSQSQSPIIGNLGNGGVVKPSVAKVDDDAKSQLSCQFSDDDQEGFGVSGDIDDLCHLSDIHDEHYGESDRLGGIGNGEGASLTNIKETAGGSTSENNGFDKPGNLGSEKLDTTVEFDKSANSSLDKLDKTVEFDKSANSDKLDKTVEFDKTPNSSSEKLDKTIDFGETSSVSSDNAKDSTVQYCVDVDSTKCAEISTLLEAAYSDNGTACDDTILEPIEIVDDLEAAACDGDIDDCGVDYEDDSADFEGCGIVLTKKSGMKRKCSFGEDAEGDVGSARDKRKLVDLEDVECSDDDVVMDTTDTSFKTPKSFRKLQKQSTPKAPASHSPGFSSTQLMEDSASASDLDALSMSQVTSLTDQLHVKAKDESRPSSARSKAKDLIERLKAKKQMKVENEDPDLPSSSPTQGTSGMELQLYGHTGPSDISDAQSTINDLNSHIDRCRELIIDLQNMFTRERKLHNNPRVEAWRRELTELEKRLVFPKTIIAVVGDTGAGKSSLMNAILDHRSVLPTSGMRACTAVVVEVIQNTTSSNFEADIEFLHKKEWFDELHILLKDLTGLDGNIKKGAPDPTSDAFSSYCKVKAVYGKIEKFDILSRFSTITHWLGKVKVIKSNNPEHFRQQVEKYIETQEPGAGGQYWPIVKHVRLRMPQCNVCSSGAALVDLPGVRDSNAARDKIAKEYLKNCTAVWVVSSIHRAIDDKTAKDLLGENFRRQLLMDGQYGSIAFICTKTDVLMPSEIIRSLKLRDETKEHEDQVSEMELERSNLDYTVTNNNREIKRLRKHIGKLGEEVEELKESVAEIGSLLEPIDVEDEESEEHKALKEYEDELKEKEEEIQESQTRIEEMTDQKHQATQKGLELEKQLNVHRKIISAICAKARNEYSKTQIRRDFKAGLKEMKRRAGMLDRDDDNEEEEDLNSDDSDDDDEDVGSNAANLRVFCCSSTEYQKMRNLLTDDGPPQVFSTVAETQIPALRDYVHEMTSVRQQQSVERLIQSLGRYVFDLHTYTNEGGAGSSKRGRHTKCTIDIELSNFDKSLGPVMKKLSGDIDSIFDGSIRQKMEEGARNANIEASNVCAKWAAPYIRDKTQDRRAGGLHFATYRATTRRQGIFTSPTFGPVDFNQDLAEPMYRSMTIVWDRAFSGMLWKVLDNMKVDVLAKLRTFTGSLGDKLESLGIAKARSIRVSTQLQASTSNKLTDMVGQLKDVITNKQRDISRIVTPHIQTSLTEQYARCAGESGTGMFMRMKTYMSEGIDRKKYTMFDDATEQLMQQLMELQEEIMEYASHVCKTLIQDLKTAFEPLWEAPSNSLVLRAAFLQDLNNYAQTMREIYRESGVENTAETPDAMETDTNNAAVSSDAPQLALTFRRDGQIMANTPEWRSHCETSHVKKETSYGSCEQFSQTGIRVKTEQMGSNCVKETRETVSRVQRLHVKQEKYGTKQDELSFGQQTLQDLQSGKLEITPHEVTIATTPMQASTFYPNTSSVSATKQTVKKMPPSKWSKGKTAACSQLGYISTSTQSVDPKVSLVKTINGVQIKFPCIPCMQHSQGKTTLTGYKCNNTKTTNTDRAMTDKEHNAEKADYDKVYGRFEQLRAKMMEKSCVLKGKENQSTPGKGNQSTPGKENQSISGKEKLKSALENVRAKLNDSKTSKKPGSGKSAKTAQAKKYPWECDDDESLDECSNDSDGTSSVDEDYFDRDPYAEDFYDGSDPNSSAEENDGSSAEEDEELPTLNSIYTGNSTPTRRNNALHTTSQSQPAKPQASTISAAKTQGKVQAPPVNGVQFPRKNLSLTQRNSPKSSPPIVIKEEPADTGYLGRIKRAKFLGTIDLTEDD